jgi:hypothetical protein
MLGIDQTYINVLVNRAFNTTYTNDTGKPIQIIGIGGFVAPSTSYSYSFNIGGTVVTSSSGTSSSYFGVSVDVGRWIIPKGATYSVTTTGITLNYWWEFR